MPHGVISDLSVSFAKIRALQLYQGRIVLCKMVFTKATSESAQKRDVLCAWLDDYWQDKQSLEVFRFLTDVVLER